MDYGALAGVADSAYKGLALGLSIADKAEERKYRQSRDAEERQLRQREEARKDAYLQMQQQQVERSATEYEAEAPLRQERIAEATLSGSLLEQMNETNAQLKEAQLKWGPSLNHSEKMVQLVQLAQSRSPEFLQVLKGSGMAQDAQYTEDGNVLVKNRLGNDIIFNDNDIKTLYESSRAAADVIYNNTVKGLIDRKNKLMSQYQQLKGREQSDEYFAQRRAIEGARQESAQEIQRMRGEVSSLKSESASRLAAEKALAASVAGEQQAKAAKLKEVEQQAFKLITPQKGKSVTVGDRAQAAAMLYSGGSAQAPGVLGSLLNDYSSSGPREWWNNKYEGAIRGVIGSVTGIKPTDEQFNGIIEATRAGKATWSKEDLYSLVGADPRVVASGKNPPPVQSKVINIIGSDGKTRAINTAKFTLLDIYRADPGAKMENGTPVADILAAQQQNQGEPTTTSPRGL